jgi:hypothetical protein
MARHISNSNRIVYHPYARAEHLTYGYEYLHHKLAQRYVSMDINMSTLSRHLPGGRPGII